MRSGWRTPWSRTKSSATTTSNSLIASSRRTGPGSSCSITRYDVTLARLSTARPIPMRKNETSRLAHRLRYINSSYFISKFIATSSFDKNNPLTANICAPASWSWGNAFVSGAGVWDSRLGPVELDTVLLTARHRCNISWKGTVLPWRNDAEMSPATRYTLRRNTASTKKDLICKCSCN